MRASIRRPEPGERASPREREYVLDSLYIPVADREPQSFKGRLDELFILSEHSTITAVFTQDCDHPRTHVERPACAAAPLQECGVIVWSSVLMTAPTSGSLKPTSSEAVATTMSLVASTPTSCEDVREIRRGVQRPAEHFRYGPRLPFVILEAIMCRVGSEGCQRAALDTALRITQVVVEAVRDIKCVGEDEQASTEGAIG